MSFEEKLKQLKYDIPALFLAIKKVETPWYAKLTAFLAVAYALSPIDLIPDFIPIIGYLDDVLLLPGLIALTIKWIPSEVMKDCRIEAENLWQNGLTKKWYYALPIIIIWILIIWLIFKAIYINGEIYGIQNS